MSPAAPRPHSGVLASDQPLGGTSSQLQDLGLEQNGGNSIHLEKAVLWDMYYQVLPWGTLRVSRLESTAVNSKDPPSSRPVSDGVSPVVFLESR